MTFRERTDKLIDKGINHLNQMHEAGSQIRFISLVRFLVSQTDNVKDTQIKNIHLLTALATIIWNTSTVGKVDEI